MMTGRQVGELADAYIGPLVLFARQWCDAPEDAVQDAFCKLVQLAAPPADPAAWLFRAVRNRAIDLGRTARRRARREAVAARPEGWFHDDDPDAAVAVRALEHLPGRPAAGDRRPAVGRDDARTGGGRLRLLGEYRSPAVRGRHRGPAGKARWRMSDDLIRRLSPTSGTLHRDDIVFAAGRASAGVWRWKLLAGGLGIGQAVTLGLVFLAWRAGGVSPLSSPDVSDPSGFKGLTPPARPDPDPDPADSPPPSSYIALLRGGKPLPPPDDSAVPDDPPLTAGRFRNLD